MSLHPISAPTDPAAALAALIRQAERITAFTGAGISTESGIPDFRSPGGVWSRIKPITFQSFRTDEAARREAWTRAFTGVAGWTGGRPNAGHFALARLARQGRLGAVITQNVDNLHQDSGLPPEQVIELHGNASYAACLDCGLRHELDDLRGPFMEGGVIPACRACSGLVKSATIAFGQPVPLELMTRAKAAALDCELFLVLGSSLTIYPAASLPPLARRHGAMLAILNRDPTPQDSEADLVVRGDIGPLLSAMVEPD